MKYFLPPFTIFLTKTVAFVLAVTLLKPLPALCKDYYVSPQGADSNEGSRERPLREIRAALLLLTPGDTVLVADGEYKGFDAVNLGAAGAAPTTIRATGKGAVVLPTKDRKKTDPNNIFITGCTNFVIDGLRTFKGPLSGLRTLQGSHVTIRNCVSGDNGKWGIVTSHTKDLLIENNECYGSGIEHGIYVANSADRPIVRGNTIHDNAGSGLRANGDISQGGDGIITGALFENNVIFNNGTGKNGGAAINLDGLQDGIIRNNLLYNNHAAGIALFKGCGAEGPKGMRILHNTIIMADDARYNLRITDAIGPITVRNNVFYAFNKKRGIISWNTASDVSFTDSDYNLIGGACFVLPNQESDRVPLGAWMESGHEKHSYALDGAKLEDWVRNAAAHDFHLTPNSPAVDRGAALTDVSQDIEGTARPQGSAPDIGAYESASK